MRFFLLLTLTLTGTLVFGQFSKSTILLGGSLGASFRSSSVTQNANTSDAGSSVFISFNPQFGYFFTDNFAAGVGVSFSSSSYKFPSSSTSYGTSSFSVDPFVRYYIKNLFFQGSAGLGNSSTDQINIQGGVTNYDSKLFNWKLNAGYAVMINKYVAIEPQAGFRQLVTSSDAASARFTDGDIFLQLGIQLYLSK